jgi:RES domain-containing protein
MLVWRIASVAYAAFDGEGARRYGSRKGLPAVFASATLSLAALERFVHTDPDLEPVDLVAISMEIGASIAIKAIEVDELPQDWRTYPAPPALAIIGERWLKAADTAVLSVPSAVIPHERNFIVNPAHGDVPKLKMHKAESFSFDPRLWKKKG